MTEKEKPLGRNDWIAAALEKLAQGGVEKVRIEPLARVLGVTKGSFYWHFKDRKELLGAILERWEIVGTQEVIDFVEASGGDTHSKLLNLCDKAGATLGVNVEVAIREWARHYAPAAEAMARVDKKRMGHLQSIFKNICSDPNDAEARSWLFYSLFSAEALITESSHKKARGDLIRKCVTVLVEPKK